MELLGCVAPEHKSFSEEMTEYIIKLLEDQITAVCGDLQKEDMIPKLMSALENVVHKQKYVDLKELRQTLEDVSCLKIFLTSLCWSRYAGGRYG